MTVRRERNHSPRARALIGFARAGRNVTLRLDGHLTHAVIDNALIGARPCPIATNDLGRPRGALDPPPPPLVAGGWFKAGQLPPWVTVGRMSPKRRVTTASPAVTPTPAGAPDGSVDPHHPVRHGVRSRVSAQG
jgi:hypothetical protein